MAGCLPAGSCAARIMLFAGGPPTIGSGKVVDMELVQPIRLAPLRMLQASQRIHEVCLLTSRGTVGILPPVTLLLCPAFIGSANKLHSSCRQSVAHDSVLFSWTSCRAVVVIIQVSQGPDEGGCAPLQEGTQVL